MTPPAMIPAAGSQASADADREDRAGDRRDELAPARDEAHGEAAHRGREDDVKPERAGSGMLPPIVTPTSVATFHGMNVLTMAPIQ